MPLLESGLSKVPGLKNITSRKVQEPDFKADDFTDGFQISEFEDGKPKNGGREDILLKGPFMPHVPFQFGGEQRLVATYYPGNSEPSVQVMGPKEKELTIKGELKLKKFKRLYVDSKDDASLSEVQVRQIAQEYQELIDAMRLRGNLVKLTMGEWHRWGFIQEVNFEFNTLAAIKYEIKFLIVGFNQPINCKLSRAFDDNLIAPNKNITNQASLAIDQMKKFPTEMPRTLSEFLNDQISAVAGAIKIVTDFVDEALSDAEQLNASVNRALGLIKNARATISKSARRINALSTSASTLGASSLTEFGRTKATIESINHMHDMRYNYSNLASLLALLMQQFLSLRKTVPLQRHLVKDKESLQKISIKYYNTSDHWEDIYDHNKLTSTQLTVGSVLEIPKL